MSKSITIPSGFGNPVVVVINGVKYIYPAGSTQTVPDEVAALLESNSQEAVIYGRSAYAHVFEPGTGTNSVVHINSNDPNTASGNNALSVGEGSSASGNDSVAIGNYATASGTSAIAMGAKVSGYDGTKATGAGAIAIGASVEASNSYALAAGYMTVASGQISTAFGDRTVASGNKSFSVGGSTTAKGTRSAAFGRNTVASGSNSFVAGKYNVPDETDGTANDKYAVIIGNGTADDARSNALTVDWDGNLVASGSVTATNIPAPPSSDGTYSLKVTVASGVATYAWVADAT